MVGGVDPSMRRMLLMNSMVSRRNFSACGASFTSVENSSESVSSKMLT